MAEDREKLKQAFLSLRARGFSDDEILDSYRRRQKATSPVAAASVPSEPTEPDAVSGVGEASPAEKMNAFGAGNLVGMPFEAQARMFNRPDDVNKMLTSQTGIVASAAGGGAAGLVAKPLAAAAPEILQGVMPYVTAAATGAGAGYGQGLGEAKAQGKNWVEANDQGADYAQTAAVLGPFTHVVGEGVSALSGMPRAAADWIRSRRGVIGSDIRALENFGSTPSPLPHFLTQDLPSAQLNKEMPNLPEPITASPSGRGLAAEMGARKLIKEVDVQDRMLGQRLRHDELPKAIAKQGDRQISLQKHVDGIDAQLADPAVDLIPGLRAQLEKAKAVLTSDIEPSMEIFTGAPRSVTTNAAPVDVTKTVTERPVTGPSRREVQTRPRGNWASEDGLDDAVSGRAVTTGEPGEMITVPTGDVRGRVGDQPNYVMGAGKLNRTRDILDDAAGISANETGTSKKDQALAKIANELRGDVRREAPAIGLANRRYAAGKRKLDLTKDRMRTENDETLAMRIAGQDEQGAKAAGLRGPGIEDLRSNFPTSEHLSQEDVNRVFEGPRALMAEERMKLLKPMGQIGGATKYAFNLQEPMVARGVYPALRFGQESLALGGATAAEANNPLLRGLIMDRERQQRLSDKLKRGGRD